MKLIIIVLTLAFTLPAVADNKIVPIKQEGIAPFTGLLVPEKRFIELLEAELVAKRLAAELESERRFTLNLENMYKAKLQETTKPLSWCTTPDFNRWFGFAIGVVTTGLALWGGIEVVKANGE